MERRLKINIISIYFPPETGAASSRIFNMAMELQRRGCDVEVITALPNYPQGKIFRGYEGSIVVSESVKGIHCRRYWVYPSIDKKPLPRVLSMLSFAVSIFLALPWLLRRRPDIVITNSPPLLVALSGVIISKLCCARTLTNISDIWPLSALELGAIKRGWYYWLLQRIELAIYRMSEACIAQSAETVTHIKDHVPARTTFLYRNLDRQSCFLQHMVPFEQSGLKIVYAGLLGVAQGMLDICTQVDFKRLGVELHIYGDGNERENIQNYVDDHPGCNIVLHKMIPKDDVAEALSHYHATLIPLKTTIHGAFPSKIFMAISAGLPIFFSGAGEGAAVVRDHALGWTSAPGDYHALSQNIERFKSMGKEEYVRLREDCIRACNTVFDYDSQNDALFEFLMNYYPRIQAEKE